MKKILGILVLGLLLI